VAAGSISKLGSDRAWKLAALATRLDERGAVARDRPVSRRSRNCAHGLQSHQPKLSWRGLSGRGAVMLAKATLMGLFKRTG